MQRLLTRYGWFIVLSFLLALTFGAARLAGPQRASAAMPAPAPLDAAQNLAASHVQTMAANSSYVFWTNAVSGEFCPSGGEPALYRVPIGGGTVDTLYHSCSFHPYQMAVDATDVYFADWNDNQIKRLPVAGGSPVTVASGSSLLLYRGLAVDAAYVYWGDAGGIERALKTGGAVQTLAPGQPSNKLALDDSYVYWTVGGAAGAGTVRRVAKSGGPVQTLVTGLNDPWGIAVDASQLYFTEVATGQAYRAAKDGSGLAAYVSLPVTPYMAQDIAVNNTSVVWTDTTSLKDGRVRRVPKGGGMVENVALGLFGPAGVYLTDSDIFWGDYNGIWRLPTGAPELRVDLSVTGLEVTQGVQCLDQTTGDTTCADNSVPLIANRPTYARLYSHVSVADTPGVTARLFGTSGGVALPGSPIAPVDNLVYVRMAGARREITADSFNFLLPLSWRSGTITLYAEINPGQVIPESDGSNDVNNATAPVTVSFAPAKSLRVAFVPVNYTWSGWKGASTANLGTMLAAGDYLKSIMPYSQIDYFGWPAGQAFDLDVGKNAGLLIDRLNQRYLASSNPPDQLFAWLPSGSWQNGLSDPKWVNGSGVVAGGDEALAPNVMAHELGHNLGRRHPTCADSGSDWPYGSAETGALEPGFDVFQGTAKLASLRELMVGGHCNNRDYNMWMTPWNWSHILNGVQNYTPSAAPAAPVIVVSGMVSMTGGLLSPLYELPEALPPTPSLEGSNYCVTFLDAATTTLTQRCFDTDPRRCAFSGDSPACNFAMRLPLPAGTARVQLWRGPTLLDERVASVHAPTVQLVAPVGGETWSGIQTVRWNASDPDGDQLTYQVLYSSDGGASWQSIAAGLQTTSLQVDTGQLPGGSNALMRVLASDGLRTGAAVSAGPFTIADHPPVVHITSPKPGAGFVPGELIAFKGSAEDAEDGPLSGERLSWSLTGFHSIGAGTEASQRIYTPGTYTATLIAADSAQLVSTDQVTFTVGTRLSLSPDQASLQVSDTITVDLRIDAVQNLYGFQLALAFDPQLLEVEDAYPSLPGVQIVQGDFLPSPVSLFNAADNATGKIVYALALQGNQPGVSGSGVLGRIRFHAKAPGVSALQLTEHILSDPFSVAIPAFGAGGQLIVHQPYGSLAGRVILERRASSAGATVCVGTTCGTSLADGSYGLPLCPAGSQTVEARHMSYLRGVRSLTLSPGGALTLPDVTLLGGDVNGDDVIDLVDGALIGLAWNTTPASPYWDARADINADNHVNILDRVAVAYNWGASAPGPWAIPVAQAPTVSARPTLGSAVPAGLSPVSAAASASVVVSPSLATIAGPGLTTTVEVRIGNVTGLYAYRIKVSFNPALVRVVDANPLAPGVQITAGDFLDPVNGFELVNAVDNNTGAIDYAYTQANPAVPRSGSGVLARITFSRVSMGTSPVHFELAQLLDGTRPDPVPIPAGMTDGQIVTGGQAVYLPMLMRR